MAFQAPGKLELQQHRLHDGGGQLALADQFVNRHRRGAEPRLDRRARIAGRRRGAIQFRQFRSLGICASARFSQTRRRAGNLFLFAGLLFIDRSSEAIDLAISKFAGQFVTLSWREK